jgi:hypothetical protein
MVQWFSGFQECSSAVRVLRSTIQKLFGFAEKQEEESTGMRKVGIGRFGLEIGIRREGVTRLIKLFYQSNSRIYKLKILFSIILKQFKLCT